MLFTLQTAYRLGAHAALTKLGAVGSIEYRGAGGFDDAADRRQEIWAEFDREPAETGEESSVGMPSAGGVNKTAKLTGGAYAQGTGVTDFGAYDANQGLPDKDQRNASAIQESYDALDDYDRTSAMDPPLTQPFGGDKYAMSALNPTTGMPRSSTQMMGVTKAPKPPTPPSMPGPAPITPTAMTAPNMTGLNAQQAPPAQLSLQQPSAATGAQKSMNSPTSRALGSAL